MANRTWFGALLAVNVAALSCGRGTGPELSQGQVGSDELATVNGAPIGEADLLLKLKADSHQTEMKPEYRKNLLEAVITQEVTAQRAVALGLDVDAAYQKELRLLEAQLGAFKRKALAELFYQKEIAAKAAVTDSEAREYFDRSPEKMKGEIHVQQIFCRSQEAIEQVRHALEEGKPFEEVARSQFADLPEGQRPWDLGYLRWNQVPEAWQEVYQLKKGAVSGVIRGPKDRFWIVKLVDLREDAAATFEGARPMILDTLRLGKVAEVREATDRGLRAQAKIVYKLAPP